MKRLLSVGVFALALLVFVLSGCVPLQPSFTGFSIEDGTYVDPRDDLTIEWTVDNPLGVKLNFVVSLNGTEIGQTESNSFTLSSELLSWGKDYVFQITAEDEGGNEVFDASVTFHTYVGELQLYVTSSTSGPGVEGASVFINGENTGVTTDSEGKASFLIEENPVSVLLKKPEYALSAVENLKVHGETPYRVLLRVAQLNPDPSTQSVPEVTVTFYTDDSKTTLADLDNLTSAPYVVIQADSDNLINIIYAAAGKIPGAGFFGARLYRSSTNTAEGYIDISGLKGETDIHIVVYDFNDNRVDSVFYANVVDSGTTEGEKYQVWRFSSFGYTNIDAYTRRSEIAFYGLPGEGIKRINPKFKKGLLEGVKFTPESAPENSNLWVEVWFIDYDFAVDNGLIDPTVVEKPEAYVIYRSFDGMVWEKAGVVKDTDGYDLVFRDVDPRLKPGVKVFYKVTAYYPDGESTPTYMGWTIPLDVFNVDLVQPADGAVSVERDPTFVWKPTKDAFAVIPDEITYDGSYTYTLWIYDLVQSENHLFPYNSDLSGQLYLESNEAVQMSLKFSDVPWVVIIGDLGGAYLYPYSTLEPNKTYEWAVDLAYAYAFYPDGAGSAYSIAIDEGYGVDYIGVNSDIFNTFTTGME